MPSTLMRIGATGVVIIAGIYFLSRPHSASKDAILRGPANLSKHAHGKATGLFDVELRSLSGPVKSADSIIELEATITAKSTVDGARFAWNLPAGVTARTAIEGSIGHLAAGETTTVRLVANSGTHENRQIHLHVFKMERGEAMGTMTQFNTADQEKIEAAVMSKAQILKGSTAEGGGSLKVIQ